MCQELDIIISLRRMKKERLIRILKKLTFDFVISFDFQVEKCAIRIDFQNEITKMKESYKNEYSDNHKSIMYITI